MTNIGFCAFSTRDSWNLDDKIAQIEINVEADGEAREYHDRLAGLLELRRRCADYRGGQV